ncbi:hypothetical protein BDZ45DRAFT_740188 [Acephala macrosclerotiorum]|nr:hypothetical protein BDZ45DRAFT_740188 [Acephala macrosclerotiorum]
MPSNNHPKKSGGRPRKHSTTAVAIEAKKQSDRQRYLRRQLQAQGPLGPTDFIAFESPLHANIPTNTLSAIGLRTNIQIPQDHDTEESDVAENLAPISPPPTQHPTSDEDAEVATQIKQIRVDEQEANVEQGEYEAEISQQLSKSDAATTEILMGLRAGVAEKIEREHSDIANAAESTLSAIKQKPAEYQQTEHVIPVPKQYSYVLTTHLSPSNASLSLSSPAPSIIRPNPAPIMPTPILARTLVARASPYAPVPDAVASPAPTERTAFKLAKQLRNFQGCTHEQYREADQLHQEHHRRPDVHSKCSSLHEITAVLRGNHKRTSLPDVFSSESLARKDSSREQLLKHALQAQYLDFLWSRILETIAEDPGYYRF